MLHFLGLDAKGKGVKNVAQEVQARADHLQAVQSQGAGESERIHGGSLPLNTNGSADLPPLFVPE